VNERFLQTQKLYQVVDFEAFAFLVFLAVGTYLFYKFLLGNVSPERHQNIRNHIRSLLRHFLIFGLSFLFYSLLAEASDSYFRPLLPYFAFFTFAVGAFCFVRTCHLLVLQYLFLSSMRTGVPLLLVNIFSLLLSIVIIFWTVSNIFGVQLTPLLATSAAFSIILGLALQDTLGNLFAGISIQMDKTFEIGNWLEVMNGNNKIVGQVKELSWRSTVLVGFADELITLPNKLIASCQISNFSPEGSPILRSQTLKFRHDVDISSALKCLEEAAKEVPEIRTQPAPSAFVLEATEVGVVIKLIYFIDNYGRQYGIGDQVLSKALKLLQQNGMFIAKPSLEVSQIK
jgi:small-conductance mechanosensitive channel